MEGDIGIRIFAQMLGWRRVLELVEQMAERRDVGVRGMQSRKTRGHGFERGPHLYHLDHFALRFANDVDPPPGYGAYESFLLEERQRFAYRCPADAERRGELPLIQTQFLLWIVDVGVRDRVLEQRIGLMPLDGMFVV